MRTIYDGLSFEVVKEAETFLGTRGITSSATGEANLNNYNPHGSDHTRGTRYYFIRDRGQELRTGKSGEALPDRTKGVRTYLYLNGERVAVNNLYNTNHGQYYYGSDILGSVKFVSGQGGQEVRRIEYDVFGGIYKGNSPYGLETGYTGKPYDAVTGFSDYGFRDYSPTQARFITEDPIRDGENWFAYVGNNPVNWIDPWGLEIILHKGSTLIRFMEDGDWEYDSVYAFQRTGLDKSFIGKILNYLGIHDNGKKLLGKVKYDYDNTYLNTEGYLDVAHDRYRIKDIHTGKDKGGLYVTAREDAKEENRVKIGQFIGSVTADAITGKGLIKGAIAGKNVLRKVTSALSEAYKPTPAGVLMTTGFAIGTATEDTTVQDVALSMIPGVGSIGAYNAWLDTMFKDTLITNSNLLKDVPTSKKNR